MTDGGSATPPRRTRMWVRVLLFVSLALNLAVAGIVTGAVIKFRGGGHDERPARIARDLGFGPYMRALTPEQRDSVRSGAQAWRGDLRTARKETRDALSATLTLLRTEPFDVGAFEQALERQANLVGQARDIGQKLLAAEVGAMTPDARKAFADQVERVTRRGPPSSKHDKGSDRD